MRSCQTGSVYNLWGSLSLQDTSLLYIPGVKLTTTVHSYSTTTAVDQATRELDRHFDSDDSATAALERSNERADLTESG